MSEEQIKSLQSTGGEHLAATEKNILGNHMGELWSTVKDLRVKTGGRIDFVLDNAGFELYCDMVYGTFTQRPPSIFVADNALRCSSRLPYTEWSCESGSLPRKEVCVVRVRRDEKGLDLATQHDGIRSPFPQSFRAGA